MAYNVKISKLSSLAEDYAMSIGSVYGLPKSLRQKATSSFIFVPTGLYSKIEPKFADMKSEDKNRGTKFVPHF
ncbi:MAG: hypothetical protein U0X91_07925 [Spirosomataceae bacterium]